MKYVMLIYQGSTPLPHSEAWEAMPADQKQQIYTDYGKLNETPGVTPGVPMGLPANATTVRVQSGKTLTTDGPFVGMKEAAGGFFVLECEDLDGAIEVASRVPAARLGGAIEIRPCETYW
ncbi:MAG TPA: YciI family protein [Candidatus Dormibacteraeota bacterium]